MTAGIMFHSVGLRTHPWRSAQVSEDIVPFERKIAALARAGYRSLHMAEAARSGPDEKAVWLTFDDGYLDNWVHVFPVLEKYGMKATIFVTPEFVDPRDVVRPQQPPGLPADADHDPVGCCAGFLSWPEMRRMEAGGLVEIQSHALTHTWYFKGPKVVDFWRPGSGTRLGGPGWMLWNADPSRKPFYLTQSATEEERIPWGTPIYENGKSLATRRFFPDPEPGNRTAAFVAAHGSSYFEAKGWRERLLEVHATHAPGGVPGRYETDEEMHGRIRHELVCSRQRLEQQLGEKKGICWPGGGVTPEVVAMAREAGYEYFTLPSAWRADRGDEWSRNMIPRMGSAGRLRWRRRDLGAPTPAEFLWLVERWRGKGLAKGLTRLSLAARLLVSATPGLRTVLR
jgi:hypothetical protein